MEIKQVKEIKFGDKARQALVAGVTKLSNAVKVTLGPEGRNALIETVGGTPSVTKDGVSVANDIELEDPVENMGASLVKSVANEASDKAGDGTTTATVLAEAIYTDGVRHIVAGESPVKIKKGIDKAIALVVNELEVNAQQVETIEEIEQVATISANGDCTVGVLIASAIEKVGKSGIITVEGGGAVNTTLEVVEGCQFPNGCLSPYMEILEPVEDPKILITDAKIMNINDLLPILQEATVNAVPLVIIAQDVGNEALATMAVNRAKGILNVTAIKAPGFGARMYDALGDLASITGGKFICETGGDDISLVTLADCGSSKNIKVTQHETTIINGIGDITERVDYLQSLLETESSDYEKQILERRISKLNGGVAIIRVGGNSEIEMQEKKDRIEDSLHATRSAIEEGVVDGGGIALIKAGFVLNDIDCGVGGVIVKNALKTPLHQIVANCGLSPEVVKNNVIEKGLGFDAKNEEYVDMKKAGIVDPLKVTRTALQSAGSVSGMLLTTECTIVNKRVKDEV